jgi:hypothetical protein
MTPAERSLRGRTAVHTSWANTSDRRARTRPGTQAFLKRFERQVDPDNLLDPAERAKRAEAAKKAYFTALSLKASQANRARKPR